MAQNKPRVIKDFEKLDVALQEQIKLLYPKGFTDHLITFNNREGKLVSALPFETDDYYYLVKMMLSRILILLLFSHHCLIVYIR